MEDHDDFEIVDNEKNGFDDFQDDGLMLNDDLGKISNLNKHMKEVEELKKYLKTQCIESSKMLKTLKDQSASTIELQSQLRREIASVNDLKASLNAEKAAFETKKEELTKILSTMGSVPKTMDKSQKLVEQLNKFYSDTTSLEAEVTSLKSLRVQQEDMIKQCKIHIETLNSNQRDCLVSLDKSKSFTCKECATDIALNGDIESKCYQVGQGQFTEKKRGYLFSKAVNMVLGSNKTENFTTGSYQIAWASCAKCSTQMGWKYISADNPTNSGKVGKYCLSRYALSSPEDRAKK